MFGLGARFHLDANLTFRVEWTRVGPVMSQWSVNAFTGGAIYRF